MENQMSFTNGQSLAKTSYYDGMNYNYVYPTNEQYNLNNGRVYNNYQYYNVTYVNGCPTGYSPISPSVLDSPVPAVNNQYSQANSSSTPKSICTNLTPVTSYNNYETSYQTDSAYQTQLDLSSKATKEPNQDWIELKLDEIFDDVKMLSDEKENEPRHDRKRPKIVKLTDAYRKPAVPFKCTSCPAEFQSTAKYLMHQHKHHNNGSSTQCPVCFKKFGNQANALVHLRAHTQEKTYKCTHCENSFCDSSTLKKHMRIHTGEKPYECKLCAKKFTQSGNLKRHILVHQKYDENESIDCQPAPVMSCNSNQQMMIHKSDIMSDFKFDETNYLLEFNANNYDLSSLKYEDPFTSL